uniref:Uncharacterized protein n=1 Tax=Plectus sambesii TaxID=2011161 RepID=A0A914WSE2_9BILA
MQIDEQSRPKEGGTKAHVSKMAHTNVPTRDSSRTTGRRRTNRPLRKSTDVCVDKTKLTKKKQQQQYNGISIVWGKWRWVDRRDNQSNNRSIEQPISRHQRYSRMSMIVV